MMDITKKAMCLLFLSFIFILEGYGQSAQFPEVGRKLPSFSLKTKDNKTFSSVVLNGKFFILDFWSIGCLTCVASFPKVDSLQEKYLDDVDILLVGRQEKKRDIRKFFDVYREKFNLKKQSYFDSITFKRFVPMGTPHLIWVNRDGIVVAITTTSALNEANLAKFINDTRFNFLDVSYLGVSGKLAPGFRN